MVWSSIGSGRRRGLWAAPSTLRRRGSRHGCFGWHSVLQSIPRLHQSNSIGACGLRCVESECGRNQDIPSSVHCFLMYSTSRWSVTRPARPRVYGFRIMSTVTRNAIQNSKHAQARVASAPSRRTRCRADPILFSPTSDRDTPTRGVLLAPTKLVLDLPPCMPHRFRGVPILDIRRIASVGSGDHALICVVARS